MTVLMLMSTITIYNVSAADVSGADIVNCAMQYVGKVPYVWGGTKIDGDNPGADCSGFICRIYEKFGIDMWANRTKLRNCGTNLGTDMSLAQLGDIIWYEGHVAIYAGVKDGHHMVVHCAGGNVQNVAYSRDSHVNATKMGIIRIPGVNGTAGQVIENLQTALVTFSLPTDSEYVAKQKVDYTNAVLVNQVTKASGTSVTASGIYLYDSNKNLINRHVENVTNVSNGLTKYHIWFDINSEVGTTLTQGTTYYYKMFGVFNGNEYVSEMYSFTTLGSAPTLNTPQDTTPAPTPVKTEATLIPKNEMNLSGQVIVKEGTVLTVEAKQNSGSKISSCTLLVEDSNGNDIFTITTKESDLAHITDHSSVTFNWTLGENALSYLEDGKVYYYWTTMNLSNGESFTSDGFPILVEKQDNTLYKVNFIEYVNWQEYDEYYIKNGDCFTLPDKEPTINGYKFLGWFTEMKGGEQITEKTVANLTKDTSFYSHWEKLDTDEQSTDKKDGDNIIKLVINFPRMYVNSKGQNIDENGTVPVIKNGRTLLPVRAVIENMGGKVSWNGQSRTVILENDNNKLFLQIDNSTAWDDKGNVYTLDTAPEIINDRTMLPIRFVAEYFGATVSWNEEDKSVSIHY